MTTSTDTLKPPVMSVGALGWLRQNLFSSWFNALLTVFALWVIYNVALGMWEFLKTAQWNVVAVNLRLFVIGRYTLDQAWRVQASVLILTFLLGASWRMWGGIMRQLGIAIGALFVTLVVLPASLWSRFFIAVNIFLGGQANLSQMLEKLPFDAASGWYLAVIIILLTAGFASAYFARARRLSIALPILSPFVALLTVYIFSPFNDLSRLYFAGDIALIAIGYALAHFTRARARSLIVALWIASPFVVAILLYGGVGDLKTVSTDLWGGLLLTLALSVAGIGFSFPLGVALAVGRQSSYPVIKWFSILYIEIVRGVPLVTVLFAAQILLPIFLPEGMTVDRVIRAMVGFTAFTAAYLAEVVRGGLQSVGRGQSEAANALGLNAFQILWLIILPQAIRNVIPAIVGQFISLFKDTSLVAIVGLLDLAGIANSVISQQEFLGKQNEVLVFIAAIYFVCCYAMTYASRRLEKKLGVGER